MRVSVAVALFVEESSLARPRNGAGCSCCYFCRPRMTRSPRYGRSFTWTVPAMITLPSGRAFANQSAMPDEDKRTSHAT
jgi:hypothetical protein